MNTKRVSLPRAFDAYMFAKSQIHDPELESVPDDAFDRHEAAFDRLMLTPAEDQWALQKKYSLFETEVLEADQDGWRLDRREHVWFASLMADAVALADRIKRLERLLERSGIEPC